MNSVTKLFLAGTLYASCYFAFAQVQDPQPPVVTATGSSTNVENRLVSSFSGFAGSEDNARSLVTGLRQGSEITLTAPGTGGQAGETATFTPSTRPMGYGNVRISLALAREQLAQNGITQPTPEQLKAALDGGTIATGTGEAGSTAQLTGVLQMRADGMGWGQIANSMGVKLGHVMSGKTGQPTPVASPTAASVSTAASAGTGVTTAAGGAAASTQTRSRGNSAAAHQSHRGTGIVTAAGGHGAGMGASARISNSAGGAGVVTGAGAAAGSRASAAGLAHGKGHARP